MSSHDFDMARFLVGGGSDIEEVYVQGAAWGPEAKAAGDLDTQVSKPVHLAGHARHKTPERLVALRSSPACGTRSAAERWLRSVLAGR